MDDQQLIQMLQDSLPQDLTPQQLEALRSAIETSDPVQTALLEELHLEEAIATRLAPELAGREQLVERLTKLQARKRWSRWRWAWMLLLLVVVLAGATNVGVHLYMRHRESQLLAGLDAPPVLSADTDKDTDSDPPPAESHPSDAPVVNQDDKQNVPGDGGETDVPEPSPTSDRPPIAAPARDPAWRFFDDAPGRGDHSWISRVNEVFTDANLPPAEQDGNHYFVRLNGKYAVTPPTGQGRIVRLRIADLQRMKFTLPAGEEIAQIEWVNGSTLNGSVGRRPKIDTRLVLPADIDDRFYRQHMLTRIDRQIDFNGVGAWSKVDGVDIGGQYFVVRWTGQLVVPRDGKYRITTTSDDGVALYIDGQRRIYNWSDHPAAVDHTQLELAAGAHELEIRYFQGTGETQLKLEWQGPEIPRQVIPAAALRPPADAVADGNRHGLQGLYCFGSPQKIVTPPIEITYASNDAMRYHYLRRGAIDLRYQNGELLLTRADQVLLALPLKESPSAIELDAQCTVRMAELLVLDPLPDREQRLATVEQFARRAVKPTRPTQLEWSVEPTEMKQEAEVVKQDDGSVVFRRLEESQSELWAVTPIEIHAGAEVILELDDTSPGTGITLEGYTGRHTFVLARRPQGDVLCNNPTDATHVDQMAKTAGMLGTHFFCRIRYGFDHVQLAVAHDGHDWREVFYRTVGGTATTPQLVKLGLAARAQDGPRSIRLRSIQVRRFAALESLADGALVERATTELNERPNVWSIKSPLSAVSSVSDRQPKDVTSEQWRFAGYVALMRHGLHPENRINAGMALLKEAINGSSPFDSILAALAEMPLRATLSADNSRSCSWKATHELWEALAAREQAIGQGQHLTALMDAWYRQDWGLGARGYGPSTIAPVGLVRRCMYESWGRRQFDSLRQQTMRFVYLERHSHGWLHSDHTNKDTLALTNIMLREVSKHYPKMPKMRAVATAPNRTTLLRHPLMVDTDRDAANTIAEFVNAVEDRQYGDACRILTRRSLPAGLVSLNTDRELSKATLVMLREQVEEHPDLARMIKEDFGSVGALRLRQLMDRGDYDGLESLATQFHGTAAAEKAVALLADHDLATGNFFSAAARYATLTKGTEVDEPVNYSAKRRLALAMTGQLVGDPVTEQVHLADQVIPANKFERLVKQLAAERSGQAGAGTSGTGPSQAPPPRDMQLREIIDVPGNQTPRKSHSLAWNMDDRHLAIHSLDEICLIDRKAKKMMWHKGQQQLAKLLADVALAPLLLSDSIIVAYRHGGNVELACLDRENGKERWRQSLDNGVVSDPLPIGSWIYAFSVRTSDQEGYVTLMMHRLSPHTGESVLTRRLVQLRAMDAPVVVGRPLQVNDTLLVRTAGTLVCCDLMGNTRWIRRLPFIPPKTDSSLTKDRAQAPMLISGRHVLVTNLGSPLLSCLDAGSGEQIWAHVAPDVQHLVGVVDNLFIVAYRNRLVALDADTGKLAWHRAVKSEPHATLLAQDGTILAVTLDSGNVSNERRPTTKIRAIQWRDATDGHLVKSLDLDSDKEGIHQCQHLISDGRTVLGIAHPPRDQKRIKLFWIEPK